MRSSITFKFYMLLLLPALMLLLLSGCAPKQQVAANDVDTRYNECMIEKSQAQMTTALQGMLNDQCMINLETFRQQLMICGAERDYIIEAYQQLYQKFDQYKREHPEL